MEKSKKRGLRRWRSYSKWMSRLKVDWATHGRQYNLIPMFEYVDHERTGKVLGWRSTLCKCFELTNREATRFKDTPTGHCSQAQDRKADGWHVKELWESRWLEVDRPHFGKPKKYRIAKTQYKKWKALCQTCGVVVGRVRLRSDDNSGFRVWMEQTFGSRYVVFCDPCRAKRGGPRRIGEVIR